MRLSKDMVEALKNALVKERLLAGSSITWSNDPDFVMFTCSRLPGFWTKKIGLGNSIEFGLTAEGTLSITVWYSTSDRMAKEGLDTVKFAMSDFGLGKNIISTDTDEGGYYSLVAGNVNAYNMADRVHELLDVSSLISALDI